MVKFPHGTEGVGFDSMLPSMTDALYMNDKYPTRDNKSLVMVFSPCIGSARMTAGTAKTTSICQYPVGRLSVDRVQRIAGAATTSVPSVQGGPT